MPQQGKEQPVVQFTPGPVMLFGSGETSPSGQRIFTQLFQRLHEAQAARSGSPSAFVPQVSILETPAGFELNSAQVAGRVGDFLRHHLQNYDPQVTVIPVRKRGTSFSPDDPRLVEPLYSADVIFMGPGSPTYAVRQLQNSLAWQALLARQRLGAALALASAATVAVSALALPVYEIYKVGEDIHWKAGLDLFGPYGLSLVFIPHWDNADGGEELDTSRCFIGRARFDPLLEQLPPGMTVVGIDEGTGLMFDLAQQVCRVSGKGGVTVQRAGQEGYYRNGSSFSVAELGDFQFSDPQAGLPQAIWRKALAALEGDDGPERPPEEVRALVEARQAARAGRDWERADRLRERIAGLGWQVVDTAEGPRVEPMNGE